MASNTTPSKKEYRIIKADELKKIMRGYTYVFVTVPYELYGRSGISVDRRYFIKDIETQTDKYDYSYEIDDNYAHTLYIERVIRTEKQQAGETGDTPGVNLVP
jgi:hypothetical protein